MILSDLPFEAGWILIEGGSQKGGVMLFFEPVKNYETEFPPDIVGMIRVLAAVGFKNSVAEDLNLINEGLPIPLIEAVGKFMYDGKVAGYLRGLRPEK